jgi:hypothetical protein
MIYRFPGISPQKSANVSIYEKYSIESLFFAVRLPVILVDQGFANLKYC